MPGTFTANIAPFVESELVLARAARALGHIDLEFQHLENAHVLGQESTAWHVQVHVQMLSWALRNHRVREAIGQTLRIVGAASKTAFGLVPHGNTGGTNVSPFRAMAIRPEHQAIINHAKS